MELSYEVEITRLMPLEVQFKVPVLTDLLYESNFEQQSLEVYDSGFFFLNCLPLIGLLMPLCFFSQ